MRLVIYGQTGMHTGAFRPNGWGNHRCWETTTTLAWYGTYECELQEWGTLTSMYIPWSYLHSTYVVCRRDWGVLRDKIHTHYMYVCSNKCSARSMIPTTYLPLLRENIGCRSSSDSDEKVQIAAGWASRYPFIHTAGSSPENPASPGHPGLTGLTD